MELWLLLSSARGGREPQDEIPQLLRKGGLGVWRPHASAANPRDTFPGKETLPHPQDLGDEPPEAVPHVLQGEGFWKPT